MNPQRQSPQAPLPTKAFHRKAFFKPRSRQGRIVVLWPTLAELMETLRSLIRKIRRKRK